MNYLIELRATKKHLYTCQTFDSATNLLHYLEIKDIFCSMYKAEKYQIKQVKKLRLCQIKNY
jgi:hypothetical protein